MDHGTLVTILVVGRVAEFDFGTYFFYSTYSCVEQRSDILTPCSNLSIAAYCPMKHKQRLSALPSTSFLHEIPLRHRVIGSPAERI